MQLTISVVDSAPAELYDQVPVSVELLREMGAGDGPRYWLGTVVRPIRWLVDGVERPVTQLLIAPRYPGGRIRPGVKNLTIGIAYVTDPSLFEDERVDVAKCQYVAIGLCHDSTADARSPVTGAG